MKMVGPSISVQAGVKCINMFVPNSGDDIEMKIDASIKVVTERRIAKPKEDEREAEESAKSARIKRGEDVVDEEVESSDRKRKESGGSMDSSDQPAKRYVILLLSLALKCLYGRGVKLSEFFSDIYFQATGARGYVAV